MTGTVVSVNVSEKKGTIKTPVAAVCVTEVGVEGDAHAGHWGRQVSLLAREDIDALSRECGRAFTAGEFAENITTSGIELARVTPGDQIRVGSVLLRVTQIGKACHGSGCAIFREVGKCAMPAKGIFVRVLRGGEIRPGDGIEHIPRPLHVLIVTLSDRAARGEYEDRSGPAIRECLGKHFADGRWGLHVDMALLPDDLNGLQRHIRRAVVDRVDVIFTTGGTGIGPRDVTPEAVRPLLDKEIPGIMESIRARYSDALPQALLSRSVAGVAGSSLVYTLPGSVKAVEEYMNEILKTLDHALMMLWGIDAH
jgi:molybdopterin adenylyltransferase